MEKAAKDMLLGRFSDSYHVRRISYGGQKLEGFVWEKGVLPFLHPPMIFHTNPYIFPSFQTAVKFFPCTLQVQNLPSLLIYPHIFYLQ